MSSNDWLKRTFKTRGRTFPIQTRRSSTRAAVKTRVRPLLEELENRLVPALVINPIFAANITSDPNAAIIEATINTAIQNIESNFTDSITVNITFQEMGTGLGQSNFTFYTFPYSTYRAA